MEYANKAKIVNISKILEGMTIDDDNIIIDNDSNFFTDVIDNKSLENEKRDQSTNMAMIM